MNVGIFYPFKDVIPGGGEKYLFSIAEALSHEHQVYLFSHYHCDFISIARKINVNLNRVTVFVLPYGKIKRIVTGLFKKEYDLFITMTNHSFPYLFSRGERSILHIQFPFLKVYERWPLLSGVSRVLSFIMLHSYGRIICNSCFTRKWIEKRCGRKLPIDVLYPPCDCEEFMSEKKEKIILSVGRYFVGWHNKKQLEMVAVFRNMVEEGLSGWEYHQVGSILPGEEHAGYFRKVKELSRGYPIVIHHDVDFEELKGLYARSTIYWHATGLEEDEEKHPEKMEHFGMSTVEAMAAGCVPVVIRRGGQPEIVEHGISGLLWDTVGELKEYTKKLTEDESYRQQLSLEAVRRAGFFSKNNFKKKLFEILAQEGIT